MSNNATLSWTATPGDILLLSGKSKGRPFNLGYQSIVRGTHARYTHVALVISPFRVIHAIPGEGVEIRAWREIRDHYNIRESSVARFQYLDEARLDKLRLKANYYFGQRYSLLALSKSSETFNNQKGIVCSQFVAQVFHDVGIMCASDGARKCLPADIHTHTQDSPDWLRIPLCEYLFDFPQKPDYDFLGKSRDISFELDGYAAKMVKENYSTSQAIVAMETTLQSMVMAVDSGQLTAMKFIATYDYSSDALSPRHWIAEWKRHFATPKSPAAFMHEDEEPNDRMRRLFIEDCDIIGKIAQKLFDYIDEIAHWFDGWIAASRVETVNIQPNELYRQLLVLQDKMQSKVDNLDRILGWKENLSTDFTLDLAAIRASGIYECEEDMSAADQCLVNIANFANALNGWDIMRTVLLANFTEILIVESSQV